VAAAPASRPTLQKIVLREGDLPVGWTSKPYRAHPSQAASDAALLKCTGTRNRVNEKVAEAYSRVFAYRSATVLSQAASYRSQGVLDSYSATLKGAKFSSCFERAVKKQLVASLPAGAKIESASFKVTPSLKVAPSARGTSANVVASGAGVVKVALNGQRVALHLTMAYITGPLFEAEVDTTNIGGPVAPSLVRTLVSSVAARSQQAAKRAR
jgi:hypothetical protein